MMRFVLALVASLLYVAMFVTIFWFFDAPDVFRGSVAFGTWLVTLGALYAAGKQ